MRSLRALVWRNLTAHRLRSILTAMAIALGVSMVLAASIVGQAAGRSAVALSGDGPRVDLEVFSRDGAPFDAAVLDRLRAYPDVDQVSPSLRVEVEGVDPEIGELILLGVDPESYAAIHEPELANGAFLDRPDTIVLPMELALESGLNVGDKVAVAVDAQRLTLAVAGRLRIEWDRTVMTGEAAAYVPLEVVQTLAGGHWQIDRVEVTLRPGVDAKEAKTELSQTVGGDLTVVRSELGGGIVFNVVLVQGGLAMVGIIILFAAGFVILNAFTMSITGRTREIGALRSLGMTRRQIMRMVLAEAGLLALLGAALGLLVGVGLAWGVMRATGTLDDVPFDIPWWGVISSPSMGLAVTLVGALAPARRASRVSPLAALQPQKATASGWYIRHGGRLGAVVLALLLPSLTAYGLIARPSLWVAVAVVGVGIVVLLGAMVLLLPALVAPLTALIRPALERRMGTIGRLAAENLTRNRLRSALTAGALVAALTTTMGVSGLMTMFYDGSIGTIAAVSNEDMTIMNDLMGMVASGELSIDNIYQVMSALPPLDPALVDAVSSLAETGIIDVGRTGIASVPSELITVPSGNLSTGIFVDPGFYLGVGNFEFFEGDPETALAWMGRGRAVLLQPLAAERLGVVVGDIVPLETSQGELDFTVAGIGGSALFSPIFSYADGEAYFDLSGPFSLLIEISEGQDADVARSRVEDVAAPFPNVTVVTDMESAVDQISTTMEQFQLLLNALLLVAVIVAGFGVVNTMAINVTERGREIGLLRAVGATQRQVRRSVVVEAATLGLIAVIIAVVLSLLMLLAYTVVVAPNGWGALGVRSERAATWNMLLSALGDVGILATTSLLIGPLVAALAAYYPARQAAAMDVVEATRSERVTLKPIQVRRTSQVRRTWPTSLPWTMAWRNLEQHRLRTALTALAVALGVAMTVAADVIRAALLNSLAGSEDAQKFMTGLLEQLGVSLQMVGVGITLAAGFLIFNAFAMAVTQRRRQIGGLRALGMTRRQVLRLVLIESLIVGVLGTLLGLVTGPLLGRASIAMMKAMLGGDLFVFSASNPSLNSMLLAAAMGLSIALLSALIPAWQAARVSPLVALREEAADKKPGFFRKTWFLVGVALLLILTVYLVVAPPGEWVEYPWDQNLAAAFVLIWLVGWGLIAPGLIGGLGRWARRPPFFFKRRHSDGALVARWGAVGRLVADNVRRGRGRVTLTILTLVVGLTMIVGMTGFFHLAGDELLIPTLVGFERLRALIVSPFDISEGMAAYADLERIALPPALVAELPQVVGDRARVMDEWRFVIVPELSFFSSSYFSLVADPHDVRFSGDVFFDFIEGDWETAEPILEDGCGVLVPPMIASRNGVSVGETFEVTGKDGPVECTLAGIGRTFVNTSIVSLAAKDEFSVTEPFLIHVVPLPGTDRDRLKADLEALVVRYPGVHLMEPEGMYAAQVKVFEVMPGMFNALLLLAILAAALGVVNTTMMSVAERRRELGLLRAVGATRRQVMRVVTGEAALMGVIGGGLGLLVGVGVVAVIVVTYGGNSWGVPDLDLWGAAWRSVQPALVTGLVGLIAAPFICAGAAWLPARSILRGSAIETMEPSRTPKGLRRPLGFMGIRARFVLGTAILMVVVLAGLVAVVTTHARVRIEEQMHDALRTMVTWNAGMIELGLPEDAETLDFDMLMSGGETFDFDSDALLRFESLVDDMTANGLVDFAIADRDNVVLVSMDTREIGTLAPELETTGETDVYSEREGGEWLMVATAPVHSDEGLLLGSVRMTVDARQVQGFLDKLRNTLGAIGAAIVLVGATVSWRLATPLTRATRDLAAHAAEVQRGAYLPYSHTPTLLSRFSLRTKLTIALTLILILMVGALQMVAIPIERRHMEDRLRDGMVAGVEWIGQAASESLDAELSDLTAGMGTRPAFEDMLDMTQTLDLARLQELTEQMRSDDMAYTALVDEDGTILLSDQLALMGEKASVPAGTRIDEMTWRGEKVWVVSTPLRKGQGGELVGALQMALRLDRLEAFLDESRNLFRLSGLIAVLAGVLLAQAIGGAVTAPVRRLAAGTRRVAEGDLTVRFDAGTAGTKDELALLANAYNQMVAGLREREWLRDMFGRFVSREVAEAIRSGQVQLEGENRVVSVLFCDIRDFTARSERCSPEEMVALLNEYLPVVVGAAQAHAGTVNKFGGDSTLVIYGAPRRLEESAYQAVLTALEMRANLERLNERLVERGEESIRIGVGINTGVALAGAVGPEERQEYTVIGDTVNLASRIEALNKDYPEHGILISGQTYEALGSRRAEFDFADLGELRIRGKAQPVRVWAVIEKPGLWQRHSDGAPSHEKPGF